MGERIRIGNDVTLNVLRVGDKDVRIGVEPAAQRDVPIHKSNTSADDLLRGYNYGTKR